MVAQEEILFPTLIAAGMPLQQHPFVIFVHFVAIHSNDLNSYKEKTEHDKQTTTESVGSFYRG